MRKVSVGGNPGIFDCPVTVRKTAFIPYGEKGIKEKKMKKHDNIF